MPNQILSPVQRAAMAAWKPQDIRMPWEWCEDHVEVDRTSPMPGKWRSLNSPWVKELMEVAMDKRISFIAVRCSAQSSKTQTILCLLLWAIAEDPGPSLYAMANAVDAEDFVRDRFAPSMHNCAPVISLLLRETKLAFTFRTMPLYFVGAGSTAKLQGKPMKRLLLDEVRNWTKGALETVLKRVTAYSGLSQVFIISTAGVKDDAVDLAFKRGDQRTFHFPCPKCGTMQQLRMEQLKAEHPETNLCVKFSDVPGAKENGQWDFEILSKAIRYQCCNPKCGHMISDTPAERKSICRTGTFIRMNPKAEACDVSFTWNALLPWWVPWSGIVKEYLLAIEAAKNGNVEPMKGFITETLGESWEDRLGVVEDFGFLEARKAEYDYGDPWAEALRLFMSADKQERGGENYYYVIRAFGPLGKSRLVAHGNVRTKAELEEIRKLNGVKPSDCMIDSGYMGQDVYRFCGATGWRAFKGEPRDFYIVQLPDPKNPARIINMRRMFQKTRAVVYNHRTKQRIGAIPLFLFSNPATNDLLTEYLKGLVGDFTIPRNCEKEYLRQLCGDVRKEHIDPKGVRSFEWHTIDDNHYRDCERMILTAALASKAIALAPRQGQGVQALLETLRNAVSAMKQMDGRRNVSPSVQDGGQSSHAAVGHAASSGEASQDQR
jgi:hypothetical protein